MLSQAAGKGGGRRRCHICARPVPHNYHNPAAAAALASHRCDVAAQARPVPAVCGLDAPHVGLQHALADGAALVRAVGACSGQRGAGWGGQVGEAVA
jgi:hypothetical protein